MHSGYSNDDQSNVSTTQYHPGTFDVPGDIHDSLVKSNLTIAQVVKIETFIEYKLQEIHDLDRTVAEKEAELNHFREACLLSIQRSDEATAAAYRTIEELQRTVTQAMTKQVRLEETRPAGQAGPSKRHSPESIVNEELPRRKSILPKALDNYKCLTRPTASEHSACHNDSLI